MPGCCISNDIKFVLVRQKKSHDINKYLIIQHFVKRLLEFEIYPKKRTKVAKSCLVKFLDDFFAKMLSLALSLSNDDPLRLLSEEICHRVNAIKERDTFEEVEMEIYLFSGEHTTS